MENRSDLRSKVERALVTSVLGKRVVYEDLLDHGYLLALHGDPGSAQAMRVVEECYRQNPESIPDIEYLKSRSVPFAPLKTDEAPALLLRRLQDLYIQDELGRIETEAQRVAITDPRAALNRSYDAHLRLTERVSPKARPLTVAERCENLFQLYRERAMQDGVVGIRTPWPGLNRLLGGLHPNCLVVTYGLAKSYKTTLCLYMAYCAAVAGHRTAVGTGELTGDECLEIIQAFHVPFPLEDFRNGMLQTMDMARYIERKADISSLPLDIFEVNPGLSELDVFAAKAERFKAAFVLLDGAHQLPVSDNWEDVFTYAKRTTQIAKRLPWTWLTSIQGTRKGAEKGFHKDDPDSPPPGGEDEPPSANLDMGGGIQWLRSCTASLRFHKVKTGRVNIQVTENRKGRVGTVRIWSMPGRCMDEFTPGVVPMMASGMN